MAINCFAPLPPGRLSQKAIFYKNRRVAETHRRCKYIIINTAFLCAFAPLRLKKTFETTSGGSDLAKFYNSPI